MAVTAIRQNGQTLTVETAVGKIRDKITAAKRDRARYEPNWLLNLAFAAGKHNLVWSRTQRKLILPTRKDRRERYAEDVLNQFRQTAIAELGVDDERPQLQFREDDLPDRAFAAQANRALSYAWEQELDAEEILIDLRTLLVDVGTAAVRCRFDPTVGPVRQKDVPFRGGQPVLDPGQARDYVAEQQAAGQSANLKTLHEGRIRWELVGPFGLLVPPGVLRERDFPWECVVRAVHLDKLKEEYGAKAADLKPDDVSAVNMLGPSELSDDRSDDTGTSQQLQDHILVYSYYERPCPDYPQGRTLILAGSQFTPLQIDQKLPYTAPDGTPRSGITYFHWWRLADRFWGRSMLDASKDLQRRINRRRGQQGEIIDRGLPKVFVEEGSLPSMPHGLPVEVVQLKAGSPAPQLFAGIQPGPWMQQDIESTLEAVQRATGIRDVSLGENPAGVTNYSQLALLREQDLGKFQPVITRYQRGLCRLVEDTVHDIRRYWGAQKQLALAGEEDGILEAAVFDATKVPAFYLVEVAKGNAPPRSQAADLKLIEEVAQYSVNAQQPVPVEWIKRSLETGKMQPLPEPETNADLDKAQLENHLMLTDGVDPPVADYDPVTIHVPEHRKLQIHAEMSGQPQLAALVAKHLAEHQQAAAQAAMEAAQSQGPPGAPGVPGVPGGPAAAAATAAPGQGFPPYGSQSPLIPPIAGTMDYLRRRIG